MKFTRKKFFDGFRNLIDPTIEQEQVAGLEFLLGKMEADPFWVHIPQTSYALATIFHETAGSFQPVEEGYYLGSQAKVKAFQKKLRYYPYFGRGYVQLTWGKNYRHAGDVLGIDLVKNPGKALEPETAYHVLTYGMHQGWFTGKKLDDYIKHEKKDYVGARKIVNGTDKAGLIAGYARSFERILTNSAAGSTPQVNPPNTLDIHTQQLENPVVTDPSPSAAAQALNQTVVDVPPVKTEAPESIVSKVKTWYAALPTFVFSVAAAFWSWLQGAAIEIVIAFLATAGIVAIVFLVINFVSRNREKQREFEAIEKQKERDFELTKLQMLSAADPNKQTVRLAPPAIELPAPEQPTEASK